MGGDQRVLAQHAKGRLTARERLRLLLDAGSFYEIGALVGSIQRGALPVAAADAFVMGHGTIEGRLVLVGAEDATVMGGTIGIGTLAKRLRLFELAARTSAPLILLLDGAGIRTKHPNDRSLFVPNDLIALAGIQGSSPIIVGVLGTCAGHGALTAAFADYLVMVDGAALFVAGPPVVAAVTGVELGIRELGGVHLHSREIRNAEGSQDEKTDASDNYLGIVDLVVADDHAALDAIRQNCISRPHNTSSRYSSAAERLNKEDRDNPLERTKLQDIEISEIIPADLSTAWNVLALLEVMADDGSLVISSGTGSVVTASMRMFGYKFVVIANQPDFLDGRIDREGAIAAANALLIASDSETPVILLTDSPGLAVGIDSESAGILSAAANLLSEQRRFSGSMIHVTLRRAYADVGPLMGLSPLAGPICSLALIGARIGEMPAETGSEAVVSMASSLAVLSQTEFGGAVDAGEQLLYDNVLSPNELINAIRSALRLI